MGAGRSQDHAAPCPEARRAPSILTGHCAAHSGLGETQPQDRSTSTLSPGTRICLARIHVGSPRLSLPPTWERPSVPPQHLRPPKRHHLTLAVHSDRMRFSHMPAVPHPPQVFQPQVPPAVTVGLNFHLLLHSCLYPGMPPSGSSTPRSLFPVCGRMRRGPHGLLSQLPRGSWRL